MGSYCRWCKKNLWLKKYSFLIIFFLIIVVAVGYPFLCLRLGKDEWMNDFLQGCSFLFLAVWLAGCIHKVIPFLEINSLLVEFSYYTLWGTMLLSFFLTLYGVKSGRYIAYLLIAVDVVLNLISRHYVAVVIDIVMVIMVIIAKGVKGR